MTPVEIHDFLKQIHYKDWKFRVTKTHEGRLFLQVEFMAADTVSGQVVAMRGRKWMLSPWMCRGELVSTAFKAIEAAEMHEMREHFLYRGKAIFGPHINPDALLEVADIHDVRKS